MKYELTGEKLDFSIKASKDFDKTKCGYILGYSNQALYDLSQKLVGNSRNATFLKAYSISYADVYDFTSVKQSLKKNNAKVYDYTKVYGNAKVYDYAWVSNKERTLLRRT